MNYKIVPVLIAIITSSIAHASDQITIMIDPAGHAKNVGRKLTESYERAETYKCAQALAAGLEKKYNIKVIRTRAPGDEIVPLQNASFANRLDVGFFIHLSMYKTASKPEIGIYHLVYDPVVDLAPRTFKPLSFIPVQQAHFKNIRLTSSYANTIKSTLIQSAYNKLFDVLGVFGIPCKPLAGIIAPAVTLEIGLSSDDQWELFIEPLIESLKFLSH